ncbi:7TM protein involved in diverse intracellular signaling [Ulvibacter sp. MAR_2010_11]|nr:7TM protein involved in diverse intracellular signaling [Ulvibacter sp. MAR_2010_11]
MAFTPEKSTAVIFKSLEFKALSEKAKTDKLLRKTSEIQLENTSYKSPKTSIAYNDVAGARESLFSENEEFSYKNDQLISSEIVSTREKSNASSTVLVQNSAQTFKNGMYYGFALMVILLNLVCYFLFDEKIFLHYFLALTGIGCTFLLNDGLIMTIGADNAATFITIQSGFLLITVGFAAWFASKYLSLSEFYPKLRWTTMALLGTVSVIIAMAWVTESIVLASIANSLSLGIMVSYFVAGVLLFSKKNYAKFYVIASAIPLLFAVDFFVLKNFGFEFLGTQPVHLKAAVLVEMLVLTYAIMYRMKAIKEESMLRQTELRIFLKRQEVMNRKNAAKLMEDVYLENLIMHYDLDGLEIKLLQYISEGKDNSKIARKLKTTEHDIEELTKELYTKLEISEHIQEDYRMVDTQPDYIYN